MQSFVTVTSADAATATEVEAMLHRSGAEWPDHLAIDLRGPQRPGFVAVLGRDATGAIDAFAQASAVGQRAWQIAASPETDPQVTTALLGQLVAALPPDAAVTWWTTSDAAAPIAAHLGLVPGRALLQMRTTLPLTAPDDLPPDDLPIRPFVPGADDDAWIALNHAAFQWHPEQGGWDLAALRQRFTEPWFDPSGFLVLPGTLSGTGLDGFCWTKIHPAEGGAAERTIGDGEIYVIGVHPAAHGRGLGKALTVAGLAHLAGRGVTNAMLYVDADNLAAVRLYERLGFVVSRRQQSFTTGTTEQLPRWDVSDVHASLASRSFTDALDGLAADLARLVALFDHHEIRAVAPRPATQADADVADEVLRALNAAMTDGRTLRTTVLATVLTDTTNEQAQALATRLGTLDARLRPLQARLAEWVASLGVDSLADLHPNVADHAGPLRLLAARADHQMPESDEHLYAELRLTGSDGWNRLHNDVTSQLMAIVELPDGTRSLPMAAVRGMASHIDPVVRRAAYDAELAAWPSAAVVCAAAMNGVKGEACVVNRRRGWTDPVDASLFANNVSRPTFQAMHDAVTRFLPEMRDWMRTKAALLGHDGGLPWWDLVAPLPLAGAGASTWEASVDGVRRAFAAYSPRLAGLVDRALAERWIDAGPKRGKVGGAMCIPFVGDRSLVLLNWSGSADSSQTTAHELGHAYHNTQLAHRTALQRQLPMALAETASIFCETLMVEHGLATTHGAERLGLLDVDLSGTAQVLVDIRSRFLFEREVYARRSRATLGVGEMNELMLDCQRQAYGHGLDHRFAHPYMWAVKPHYYSASFYNWPYTFGLLFGLGLYSASRADPERFGDTYDDVLSRVGMEPAESIGAAFGYDLTDGGFWDDALDVVRTRIHQYTHAATVAGR